jgi:hypothetical protein
MVNAWIPILIFFVVAVAFGIVTLLFAGRRPGMQPGMQVRHRTEDRRPRSLQHSLLPGRDAVRDLRRGDGVHVSVGREWTARVFGL